MFINIHNRRLIATIGVFILSSIVLLGCNKQQAKRQMPPPTVSVYSIKEHPVGLYSEYVARTEAVDTVQLRARVEGFLVKRNFTEGEAVQKGQLLFEIDPKPYVASVRKAKADLSSASAELNKAERDFKRNEDLFNKGHVSQADLDTQISYKAQAKAAVEIAKAQLVTAKLNLGYTQITAPFSGQIGRSQYSIGSLVSPSSDALATLTSVDPIYANFQINEKLVIDYLQNGVNQKNNPSEQYNLYLRLPNGSQYKHTGIFNFADTHIDELTGTLTLRAEFPNPDGVIIPGLFSTLSVEGKEKTNQALIPQAAVQENQTGRYVLVLDDSNQVTTRAVELGRRIGPMWVVNNGIKASERIIVEGLQKVRPGATVTPTTVSVNHKTGTIEPLSSESQPTATPDNN